MVPFAGYKPNLPPNAQAGPDQIVDVGDKVTLRGRASDPDGKVHTYRWKQIAGPSVLISNENQAFVSFVAPEVKGSQVLAFRLTVVDDNNATATDEMVVTIVGRLNQSPNAQAGSDQTVDAGRYLISASRGGSISGNRYSGVGFRVARSF